METSEKLTAWEQVKEIDWFELQEKSVEELLEFCHFDHFSIF